MTETGATLNGTVGPNGVETKYYFEYGTTESYGKTTAEAGAGSSESNVEESKAVTGLTLGTTYDFRIVAIDGVGMAARGANQRFTPAKPSVETKAATSIGETAATLHGTVNPNGFATKYYFQYGTEKERLTKTTTEASAGSGTSRVEESKSITGLAAGTEYYFRIVATNSVGTTDGGELSFTTLGEPAWTIQASPTITGAKGYELDGVSCSSSVACTSVGEYENSESVYVTLAEQWNGTEWAVQTTPDPSGAKSSLLHGVSCSASAACMSVGEYRNSESNPVNFAESWNGTEWKVDTVPDPTGTKWSQLRAVSCSSSTSCIAVGDRDGSEGVVALAESWNGTEWKAQAAATPTGSTYTELRGVSCISSKECIAGGEYTDSGNVTVTLAEIWNGTEWKVQTTPNPAGATYSDLHGVSCASATACTAAGFYVTSTNGEDTLVEVWNGTEWKIQTTPNVTGAEYNLLGSVSCVSSTACTVTEGYRKNGDWYTLAEHWNGTEWKIQTTPNPTGAKASGFSGVSCTSAIVCIATGSYTNGEGKYEALAEKY